MSEQTTTTTETTTTGPTTSAPIAIMSEEPGVESAFFHISVRAWITILLILTCCVIALMKDDPPEFLKALTYTAVGWYFGQKKQT